MHHVVVVQHILADVSVIAAQAYVASDLTAIEEDLRLPLGVVVVPMLLLVFLALRHHVFLAIDSEALIEVALVNLNVTLVEEGVPSGSTEAAPRAKAERRTRDHLTQFGAERVVALVAGVVGDRGQAVCSVLPDDVGIPRHFGPEHEYAREPVDG